MWCWVHIFYNHDSATFFVSLFLKECFFLLLPVGIQQIVLPIIETEVCFINMLTCVSVNLNCWFVSFCHCFFISSCFSLFLFIYVGIIERTLSALRWHVNWCMSVLGMFLKRKNDHCTVKSMLFYSTNSDCMKFQRVLSKDKDDVVK